jgi:ASPIC and UnbV
MTAQMKQKGFDADDSSVPRVCQLTVEILAVKTVNNSLLKHMNPVSTSVPGVTVTAAIEVKDSQGKHIYKKEFKGEADVAPYTMEKSTTKSNKLALNTRARVVAGDLVQTDEVRSRGSYLSQHDLRLHFGLAQHGKADKVEIRWPSGAAEALTNLEADRFYCVKDGAGVVPCASIRPTSAPTSK